MRKKDFLKTYLSYILNIVLFIFICKSPLHAQNSFSKKERLDRLFNFNFKLGAIVNNSFSNLFSNDLDIRIPSDKYIRYNYKYSKSNSTSICYGLNFGTELQIGKGKFIKQIIELNYDFTNSKYNFYSEYLDVFYLSYSKEIKNLEIKKNAHFISFGYGFLFKFPLQINLSTVACVNLNTYNVEKRNGTILSATNSIIYTDTTCVNNVKVRNKLDTSFLSVRVKVCKEFILKEKKVSVFLQHNISLKVYHNNKYIAPWWIFGIQFNPFDKNKYIKK